MQTKDLVAIATIAFLSGRESSAQDWYPVTPAKAPEARRFHGLAYDVDADPVPSELS